MNLLNDLENELAQFFLVEKRYVEKIDSRGAQALIAKVKKVLQPLAHERNASVKTLAAGKDAAA